MTFDKYISHPAKTENETATLLIGENGQFDSNGHLRQVANRMMKACKGQTLSDDTPAEVVAEVIGLTHDFAKLTSWAQKHLRNEPFQHLDEYRYHSFPSSLVTLYCLLECRNDVSEYAAEVATLVVIGHHNTRRPPDSGKVTENYGRSSKEVKNKYKVVCEQFDNIDEHVPNLADLVISEASGGVGSWDDFRNWHTKRVDPIDGIHNHILYFAGIGNSKPDDYYADTVRLWTSLKFADQTSASGLKEADLGGTLPNLADLENHISDLDIGSGIVKDLNRHRNQARKDVTENITNIINSNSVGLITLPTGFGKTYAGLSSGLQAAEIKDSRLIYVLPYTSILDQTAAEIQNVFGVSPYGREFTLHHHLSETYTGLGDYHTDADIGRSPGSLHAESWLSGLTLTTTVQLFESLTAPTARQSTRIPSLYDSVIVIDEPQAIPEDWWQIVPVLVEMLVYNYNATVILMTATQPGIVKYGSDRLNTIELTNNTSRYTNFLDSHPRVKYRLHNTIQMESSDEYLTVDYPTAGGQICDLAEKSKDVLAVCNTRSSAEELYKHTLPIKNPQFIPPIEIGKILHEYVEETGDLPTPVRLRNRILELVDEGNTDTVYAFLSGDVRPDDRSLIIDTLYNDELGDDGSPEPLLDSDISVVLISTSVVEAGVDVSFDTVFRDYAPIPNIVQSGGRCNRSFGSKTGDVIVWRLAEPKNGNAIPSIVIHGGDGGNALPLLRETGRVLRQYATDDGIIDEATMVSETVEEFYKLLFDGRLNPGDERLVEFVSSASMTELEGEHMIEEIETYDDVVACLTDKERDDLLGADINGGDIGRYPGTQVNTRLDSKAKEISVGNSTYLLLDARETSYHPVFGVQ